MKHLKTLATIAGLWTAVLATGFAFMYQYTLLAETLAWGIRASNVPTPHAGSDRA